MTSTARTISLALGAVAVAAAGSLTACGSGAETGKPAEGSPSQTSPPSVAPTQKQNVGSFAPSITAPSAPTALPGHHRH